MDFEAISFTLIIALLGMVIVFLFLGILYLIMILLKIKIKNIIKSKEHKKLVLDKNKLHNRENSNGNKSIEWLMAALVAYLELESKTVTPTAIPWAPNKSMSNITWIITNRINRNGLY